VRDFLNWPRVNASLTALGVACGVLLIAYLILIPVELILATDGMHSPSILPPPTARSVVVISALVAITIGFLVGRDHYRGHERFHTFSLVPLVLLVIIASLIVGTSKARESNYLSYARTAFPNVSDQTLKADGHQACDWLRGRHWGRPPELPRGNREPPEEGAAERAILGPGYPTMVIITSTGTLYIYYSRYLDRQNPGPLTQADRLRLQVTYVAWYKLCHFQQWVHRPVQG
jgi:hypothetical protein